jgi:hypothetical protein
MTSSTDAKSADARREQRFIANREIILNELFAHDVRVSGEYFHLFKKDCEHFAEYMAQAVRSFESVDKLAVGERRSYVAAFANTAIYMHVNSMALFMNGHLVAAGNLVRQVTEAIAATLLFSAPDLTFLPNFIDERYSTSNAVTDLLRHCGRLHVPKDSVEVLTQARSFYHLYSHPTRMTLGAIFSFGGEGTYVGASFDPGKVDTYRREVSGRVDLARVFNSFIHAVRHNLEQWPADT